MKQTKPKQKKHQHHGPSPKRKPLSMSPWAIKITIFLLGAALVTAIAVFYVPVFSGGDHWDDVMEFKDETYMVFYYHPDADDFYSLHLHDQAVAYRSLETPAITLYFIDATRMRGEAPARVDADTVPQLWVVTDRDFEYVIMTYENIKAALFSAADNQLENYRNRHLSSFDDVFARNPSRYFVYFHASDDIAVPISPEQVVGMRELAEYYEEHENKTLPIYFAAAHDILPVSDDRVDFDTIPQLWIINDGELEAAVTGHQAMVTILGGTALKEDDPLPVLRHQHIHHWDDVVAIEDELFFVYYYQEGNESYEEMFPVVVDFQDSNPMDIPVYYVDKETAWGLPQIQQPWTYSWGTGGIYVFHNGIIVRLAGSRGSMQTLIQEVYDGEFSVVNDD